MRVPGCRVVLLAAAWANVEAVQREQTGRLIRGDAHAPRVPLLHHSIQVEVLQAAHREQALGEGIDSAHVWGLVCNCQGINFQRMCRIACRLAGSISAAC